MNVIYEMKSLVRSESFIILKSELNLFIDNDLWRCGARIQNADLLYYTKNLLILPRDNYFAKLLVLFHHDLLRKSVDWFLYDNGLRHERVKGTRKTLNSIR